MAKLFDALDQRECGLRIDTFGIAANRVHRCTVCEQLIVIEGYTKVEVLCAGDEIVARVCANCTVSITK
jgi:hypothetical protein